MKLYYINPNDYGTEYFVMTESKEQALECVKKYLKEMADGEAGEMSSVYGSDYDNLWKEATVNNLPNDYTIDEYKQGEVIETFNG
jgi:hypothetical protein